VKFWDSSAIVPLLVAESSRDRLLKLLEQDRTMLVWWGTPVECTSAIARREREGNFRVDLATQALERLHSLSETWYEVVPSASLRIIAQRLLRVHALRAADALQLAAAVVASDREPATLEFVSLDDPLNTTAQREGFRIISVTI
jgi:predicted nucleic acid-binding protein